MKNILLLIITIILTLSNLKGQEEIRPYRQFATQKVHQRLLKENPNLSREFLKMERRVSKNNTIENHLNAAPIPLFFHVIYREEEQRISYEQIISQIQVLNEDFAFSLQPDVVDIQSPYDYRNDGETKQYQINLSKDLRPLLDIKFCLAGDKSINQQGINYIPTTVKEWDIDDAIKDTQKGGANAVHPNKYINVWIGRLGNNISGYAQMPGGPTQTDGIVIDYRFFGRIGTAKEPFDLGKTGTHLMGNFLGLMDLWNETNPCADDYVTDTPIHNAPNSACPQYMHISTCPNEEIEMVMNNMDNTFDICMRMFTVGQMKRIYKMLAPGGPRHSILNSETNCDNLFLDNIEPSLSKLKAKEDTYLPIVQISPNPAYHKVNIEITNAQAGSGKIYVYSTLGNLVHVQEINLKGKSLKISIPTQKWQSGIYVFHIALAKFKIAKQVSVLHK